jgi:uncharacterized membrane protein
MADARPERRWVRWALVASLGLNLAAAGLIGGALLKGPPPGPPPGISLGQYARALPDPYRKDLGRSLRESRRDWIGSRRALAAQEQALAAALTAEPFDPAMVEAVLAREAELTGDLAARGSAMLVAQIARMSPEERAAYAKALEERRERRRDREHERARDR